MSTSSEAVSRGKEKRGKGSRSRRRGKEGGELERERRKGKEEEEERIKMIDHEPEVAWGGDWSGTVRVCVVYSLIT